MIIEERYSKILEIVKEKTRASYDFLAKTLFVSESTIRRDIEAMSEKGMISKIHGGASIIEPKTQDSSVYIRENKCQKEEKYISSIASKLIKEGMSIFLDASTSSSHIIPYLSNYNSITVVTNGIYTALQVINKTNCEIFLAGGQILKKTNATYGPDVISFINNITCDIVFFSCKGLDNEGKITEANYLTKGVKSAMIKNAKTKVLLIDSSKFNKRFMLTTCELKDIDYVITDKRPSDEIIEICKKGNTILLY